MKSADWYNSEALACEESGDPAKAENLYLEAIRLAPHWPVPWYNLGLLYKSQRRWPESRDFNLRAAELDPEDEAAWWNLGIAATALGDWATARSAWKGFGIPIPEGDGPIEMDLGLTPIRLDPEGRAEVVWCSRIDPARAIIRSVPTPETRRRFGDLLLHDGEPKGTRLRRGAQVPVFNEIELLTASPFRTFSAVVEAAGQDDIEELAETAFRSGLGLEDWSTLRFICRACSEGSPHEHHDVPEPGGAEGLRTAGIAATTEADARRLLEEWAQAGPDRGWRDLQLELDA